LSLLRLARREVHKMDEDKTKEQLVNESAELRRRVAELEAAEAERKQAELELQESERRFRNLLDNVRLVAVGLDHRGRVTYANPHFLELTGYTRDEVLGKNWFQTFIPERNRPAVDAVFDEILESESHPHYENPILTKDGEERLIAWNNTILLDPNGKPMGTMSIGEDITERKRAEEALRESEDRYRDVVEHTHDLICVHDLEGQILSVNQRAATVLGYDQSVLMRKNIRDILLPEVRDEFDAYLAMIQKDGVASGLMLVQTSTGERQIWEYDNILLTEGIRGATVRGMAHDITERKRAERLLQALNRAALTMERALTPEEIFTAAAEEFKKLGFSYAVFLTDESQSRLFPKYLSYEIQAIKVAEKLSGLKAEDFSVPVKAADTYRQGIWKRQTVFVENVRDVARQILPGPLKGFAEQIVKILKVPKSIDAPLIVEDEVIGLLSVQSDDLTENDLPAVTAFAHQMAAAWRKVQLLEQAQARSRYLETLERVNATLRSTLPLEQVLQIIARGAVEALDYVGSLILVPDAKGERLTLGAVWGGRFVDAAVRFTGHRIGSFSLPMTAKENPMVQAYLTGEPLSWTRKQEWIITGVEPAIPKRLAPLIARAMGAELATCVPLRTGDKIVGVLIVFSSQEQLPDEERAILLGLADQAGLAIQNAQLYQSAQQELAERKRTEAERERLLARIQEQAQQVQQIVNTVPEGMLLLNADEQVILANPVAEKDLPVLTGIGVGDKLTHLGDRPLAELLTSPPAGLWHEVATDDRNFEVIARPLETGPKPEGWVLVIRDVTQEREIQERAHQQERLAAVGQLAAGIAHDFNNIMATIILYAQILSQAEGLPPRGRERLATINQQAKHAANLTQQILDFSRRAMLERRPLDLALFLKEQVKLLERTLPESIEIKLTYGPDEYTVDADPMRIQQAVMNLALNARDAMPEGGKLRFGLERVRIEDREEAPLPEMEAGEWVQVAISDTGTGIPSEVLPHIFDPFFTTKEPGQGSGLGLAQVYGIVSQHEGYVDVESQVGQGTTLIIYFPALPTHRAEPPTAGAPVLVEGHGETILVVEDSAPTRKALVDSLELLNHRVLEAANGQEALAVLEQHGDEIALVLSDVVMPGMGGIALLHELRQRGLKVGVVLLTGHPLQDEMESLRAQGMTDWLPKPPSLEQLAEVVARALAGEP
jgi:PAS domain S-box-containing protein